MNKGGISAVFGIGSKSHSSTNQYASCILIIVNPKSISIYLFSKLQVYKYREMRII